MILPGAVQAHQVCVTNASELQAALDQAAVTSDEGSFINIAKGTYKTTDLASPARFIYQTSIVDPQFFIVVRGGWNADCTVRTAEANDTILDGDHTTQVLVVRIPAGHAQVYGLTIQNGETDQPGAGLAINELGSDHADVTVSTNIIRNNHTSRSFGGFRAFASGTGDGGINNALTVRNNVIYGNSADQGNSAGEAVGGDGGVVINNNTVTQNSTIAAGAAGGLSCFGPCTIANNIFWNNDNIDLYLSQSGALFDYNDVGVLGGSAPAESTGDVQVDPQFVEAADADFHLSGSSPLVAFSPELYPLDYPYTDPDGDESPTSGRMDAGAYQETIFVDRFEGN